MESTNVTIRLIRGQWVSTTTEGHDIPTSELTAGMEVWNSGLATWIEVSSVGKVSRGKVTVGFSGDRNFATMRLADKVTGAPVLRRVR